MDQQYKEFKGNGEYILGNVKFVMASTEYESVFIASSLSDSIY